MATRIYTNSSGVPAVTPTDWEFAAQINPVSLPGTLTLNTGSVMTAKTEATGTASPTFRAMGRTIVGPLAAMTISGTIRGQMRAAESNAGANATLALAVKLIQPSGADRGVLLAPTASDAATAGNELLVSTTTPTNAQFKDAAESVTITLTSQAAQAGDYLVIEWGFRSATTTTRNILVSYGNDSATDLPLDTTTTTAQNPWWEFSQTFGLLRPLTSTLVGASLTTDSAIALPMNRLLTSSLAGSSLTSVAASHFLTFSEGRVPLVQTRGLTVPATLHGLGTPNLLVQAYDASTPYAEQVEGVVEVNPTTGDVAVGFVQRQDGFLLLGSRAGAAFAQAFTSSGTPPSVTLPAATHGYATPNLLVQVFDTTGVQLRGARIRVHQTTFEVRVEFGQAQTGTVVVAPAHPPGPPYPASHAFTAVVSVTVPVATHGLGATGLLADVYDTAGLAVEALLTVEPDGDVAVAFLQSQSGRVVISGGTGAGQVRQLTANLLGASTTPASLCATLRGLLTSVQAASTTPDSLVTHLRALPSTLAGASTTPPVVFTTGRFLASTVLGASLTPASLTAITRPVISTLLGASTTPAAEAVVQTGRQLVAVLLGASVTPGSLVTTLRSLPSNLDGTSLTPAALTSVLRPLAGTVGGVSVTADTAVVITTARPLQATVVGASTTPTSLLSLTRGLVAQVLGASLTADPTASMLTDLVRITTPLGANHGYTFTARTTVFIPGLLHGLGTTALHVAVYDDQTPRMQLSGPITVAIDPVNADVTVTFLTMQAGMIVLNAGAPDVGPTGNYGTAFTTSGSPPSVAISGATHQLATPTLLVAVYDTSTPRMRLQSGPVTIDPITFDVVIPFLTPQAGFVVLCGYMGSGGTANSLVTLPGTTAVSIPQATHGLDTDRLLITVYDASEPRQQVTPGSVTVDPVSHLVTLGFVQAQTGSVALNGSTQVLGGTTRLLTAALQGQSLTPAALTAVARPLSSTLVGSSLTPAAVRVLQRFLVAQAVAGSVTPDAAVVMTTLRPLVGQLTGSSATPDSTMDVVHNFTSSVVGTSTTPLVVLNALRALNATVLGASATPASLVGQERSVTASLAGLSTTPVAVGGLVRGLVGNLSGSSLTPNSTAGLGRGLTGALVGSSTTPLIVPTSVRLVGALLAGASTTRAATASLTAVLALNATLLGNSTTPAAAVAQQRGLAGQPLAASLTPLAATAITRPLTSTVLGVSLTPASGTAVQRPIVANLDAVSLTSVVDAVLLTGRILAANVIGVSTTPLAQGIQFHALRPDLTGVSLTPDADVTTVRRLAAGLVGASTTPGSLVTALRSVAASVEAISLTSDPAVVLTALRELTAALGATSMTPPSAVTQARQLVGVLVGDSTTPPGSAVVQRPLTATILASSTAPPAALVNIAFLQSALQGASITLAAVVTTVRPLTAYLQGLSSTPFILGVSLRPFQATLVGDSATPDSAVVLVRRLASGFLGQSTTPLSLATLSRDLLAACAGVAQTSTSLVTTVRLLGGDLSGVSVTPVVLFIPNSGEMALQAALLGMSATAGGRFVLLPMARVSQVPFVSRGAIVPFVPRKTTVIV